MFRGQPYQINVHIFLTLFKDKAPLLSVLSKLTTPLLDHFPHCYRSLPIANYTSPTKPFSSHQIHLTFCSAARSFLGLRSHSPTQSITSAIPYLSLFSHASINRVAMDSRFFESSPVFSIDKSFSQRSLWAILAAAFSSRSTINMTLLGWPFSAMPV